MYLFIQYILWSLKVLWSDGRKSWLKECNLPKKLEEIIKSGKDYSVRTLDVLELGQPRRELQLELDSLKSDGNQSEGNIVER